MEPAVPAGPPATEDAPVVADPAAQDAPAAPAGITNPPAGRGGEGVDSVLPYLRELERDRDRVGPTERPT